MKVLSLERVRALHDDMIDAFGGAPEIHDLGLLESALAAPFQTFGGEDLYPSLQAKAAQLGFGIAANHAFRDGNKRTGAHVMLVFLALNGVELDYTQDELSSTFLKVADGKMDSAMLLQWVLDHQI